MAATKSSLAALTLGAIGVVYGDIDTSVLYALKEVFNSGHVAFTPENIYGILSLFVWTLTTIVSVKYVVLVLRADNNGEDGLVAMLALASQAVKGSPRLRSTLLIVGIFGTSLFYGDGVITPAISVLSAVEGLEVISTGLHRYIEPLTLVILFLLFVVQKRGTAGIGKFFGPVTLDGLWRSPCWAWRTSAAGRGAGGGARATRGEDRPDREGRRVAAARRCAQRRPCAPAPSRGRRSPAGRTRRRRGGTGHRLWHGRDDLADVDAAPARRRNHRRQDALWLHLRLLQPRSRQVRRAHHHVDLTDPTQLAAAISRQTRVVFFQTPANPNMRLIDIAAIGEIAHAHGAQVVVRQHLLHALSATPA